MTTRTVKTSGVSKYHLPEPNYQIVTPSMRLAGTNTQTHSSDSNNHQIEDNVIQEFRNGDDELIEVITTDSIQALAEFPGDYTKLTVMETGETDHLHISLEVSDGVGFKFVRKGLSKEQEVEVLQQFVDNDVPTSEVNSVQTTLGIDLNREQIEKLYLVLRKALQPTLMLNTNQYGYRY